MAEKERLTKFTIRQSLKALQERRKFSTLDELAAAVAEDLADEGFLLDVEDQQKIRKIVDDEGYTGRFSIDDWFRRRSKGVAAAVVLFLVTTVVGAKIEGFVQKAPSAPGQVTAVFQAPTTITEHEVPFKLLLSNVGSVPLKELAVFISGPGPVAEFHVDRLDPQQPKSLEGNFKVKPGAEGTATLTAYVVASGFSLKSEPVEVALQGDYVADTGNAPQSVHDGSAHEGKLRRPVANKGSAYENAAPALESAAAVDAPLPPSAPVAREAPVAEPAEMHPVNSGTEVDLLASQAAALPAEAPERAALKAILQGYADAGEPKAKAALTKL